jgi:hypothetical protein
MTQAKKHRRKDSATQMVEVIWPLSTVPCQGEGSSGRSVLPLRTYIEETLRRSRTSYSTLQVALYYLVLIKASVPFRDFTMEQSGDCPASRALMCGRRMFLAALILASKYLQDRNYSTKAWSKMSGLRVSEINSNERTFLAKIGWKLHVAKPLFDRWTDIVLKYQTMPPSGSPGFGIAIEELCWKRLVPMLTPELNNVPLPERMAKVVMQPACGPMLSGPVTPTPIRSAIQPIYVGSSSNETTPTPASICPPRFLEPQPTLAPPTLPRLAPLPTPQMTPSIGTANTPAASVCGFRRPSICSAMASAYRNGLNRCTNDEFPFPSLDKYRTARRPSVSSSRSQASSPESMVGDFTRSSRASSISSVTTVSSTSSCVAPPRPNLARLATTRNARLPMPCVIDVDEPVTTLGTATKPILVAEEDEVVELDPPDFAISEKKLHTTHRHTKYQQQPTPAPSTEKSRKRNRLSRGSRRSELYDEVRYQLEEDQDVEMIDLVDCDADVATRSPAVSQACRMLSRENSSHSYKEAQPPASLSRRDSSRLPVQRNESKRSCCTASAALKSGFRRLV